jgi:hypothetical protein
MPENPGLKIETWATHSHVDDKFIEGNELRPDRSFSWLEVSA